MHDKVGVPFIQILAMSENILTGGLWVFVLVMVFIMHIVLVGVVIMRMVLVVVLIICDAGWIAPV